MRYLFIAWSILFSTFMVTSLYAQEIGKSLLSTQIELTDNTPERIALTWNFKKDFKKDSDKDSDKTRKEPERILLFVPGPISSATYFISEFSWLSTDAKGETKRGDETNFPTDNKEWGSPRISLREIGTLAGARIVALSLNQGYHHAQYTTEAGEELTFPRGKIEIRFSSNDPSSFIDFPTALDPIAQRLVLNYPPLRTIETKDEANTFPPYFSTEVLKIQTRQSGIITLSGKDLLASLNNPYTIEELSLFQNRIPIPFVVADPQGRHKNTGSIESQDTLQFYSPPSFSPYSPETVTWIAPVVDCHRQPSPLPPGNAPTVDPILERRIRLEEDRVFIEDNDKNDNQSLYWMWHDFIQDGTKTISFSIPFSIPSQGLPRSASVHISLRANQTYIFLPTDALQMTLNDQPLSCLVQRPKPGEFFAHLALAPDALKSGTNTIVIDLRMEKQYSHSDVGVYLDKIDLYVPALITPSLDPYGNPEGLQHMVLPSQNGGVWLTRKEGDSIDEIYYSQAGAESIELPTLASAWQIYTLPARPTLSAVSIDAIHTPLANHPLLIETDGADILLVSPRDWLPILQPFLQNLRTSNDRVRHAAVEDLYDLFGEGRLSPHALRNFLRYAYLNWQRPQPSYVLLVGDATWDYWGRYNNGVKNYVPGYREEEKYASESWFVRLDDPMDNLPDSMIARWPVQSATDLQIVVDKTLRYKNNPPIDNWLNKVFMLTDDTFEKYSQELLDEWIPPAMRTVKRHIADYPLIDNVYLPEHLREQMRSKTSLVATQEILQIINQGVFLWNYFGHGAPNVLGNERMFFGGGSKYSDAKKLTNRNKLPMLWAFTCETATFDYPRDKWNISIGEDMLTFPDGGMIALVGATGRGYPTDHIALARGMHQAAFRDRFPTLGQIFFAANLYGLSDMAFFEPLNQFAILGDPTLVFPEYRVLTGQATRNPEAIDFRWTPSSQESQPSSNSSASFSVWAETAKSILDDPNRYRFSNPGKTLQGTYKIPNNDIIHKIGIDSIERKNRRIVVTHGAVSFADEILAASFIEPTTGCLPDLTFVPDSLQITPQTPRAGETVFLKAQVRNIGQASASNISIQGHDLTSTHTQAILTIKVGRQGASLQRLDPGTEAPIQVRWDPTDNAGHHRLRLTVDADKRIAEENEENNTIVGEIQVLRKADLIVDASSVDIQPIEGGKRLQIYFEMRNQGESPAEKIVVELIRKDRGIPTPEPFRIPQLYELTAGAFRAFGGIKLPADIEWLDIVVDPDEIIDEETHTNNRYRYTH